MPGLNDVQQVALGYHHSCVLHEGGHVSCWGFDLDGEVGSDRQPQTLGPLSPVEIPDLQGVTQLAVGDHHGCALLLDKTVVCWGRNASGQLGDASEDSRSKPMPVKDLSGVIHIATGAYHSCALLEGGKLMCWGSNAVGELGNYGTDSSSVPLEVPYQTFTTVKAQGTITLALSGSAYYGWGRAVSQGPGYWAIERNYPGALLEWGLGANAENAIVDASEGLACVLTDLEHHCWGIPWGSDAPVEWP